MFEFTNKLNICSFIYLRQLLILLVGKLINSTWAVQTVQKTLVGTRVFLRVFE